MDKLGTAAGPVWVVDTTLREIGTRLRQRVHASDVILSRNRPEGLPALNILQGGATRIEPEPGGRAFVQLAMGEARLTQRSVLGLGLAPGVSCHAILKSVAVSRDDPGGA